MWHNMLLPSYTQHHSLAYFGHDVGVFNSERFLRLVLEKVGSADVKVVCAFGDRGVCRCAPGGSLRATRCFRMW
jgi:hypothetical protein